MKPGLGTAAALLVGVLATIGSIAMGISNLQVLLQMHASRAPCGIPACFDSTAIDSTAE